MQGPGEGEVCAPGWLCAEGLECNDHEVCYVPLGAGEACTARHPDPEDPEWIVDDCDHDHYYCGPQGVCTALLPAGAACNRDEMCDSYWCENGMCVDEVDVPIDFCEVPEIEAD
jgi:hypothetical protein